MFTDFLTVFFVLTKCYISSNNVKKELNTPNKNVAVTFRSIRTLHLLLKKKTAELVFIHFDALTRTRLIYL